MDYKSQMCFQLQLEESMLIKLYKSDSQIFLTNKIVFQEMVSNGEKNG